VLFDVVGEGANFERMIAVQDHASGLRALIVVHSRVCGPAFGGIRRRVYPDEQSALRDAARLAASMTAKCALAGLPAGGAKCVILDHAGLDRPLAYAALGRAVEEMGGHYICGPDVGTGERELDALRGSTTHVNPSGNDAGAATASGVLAGLRGLLRVTRGSEDVGGLSYFVQGLGSVGLAVAGRLRAAGAVVHGYDPREDACRAAIALGVQVTDASRSRCDVFMPCAMGDAIDSSVAKTAQWGAVCGSANNQLGDNEVGDILHARGIAWAPDVVVSAGAVIEGVLTVRRGTDATVRVQVESAIAEIADTCESLLLEAEHRSVAPGRVAAARVRSILAQQ